jgi:multimeric flavodoxin WrbA
MRRNDIFQKEGQMNILAVVGSPRPDGNTNYLVDRALQEASTLGAGVEKIVLSEYELGPCLAHINCRELDSCAQQDDGGWILQRFSEADGVILATPVYYYDISAWMKIFIDRNYFLGRHGIKCRAKAVGIIVVAGGAGIEDTVNTLIRFVNSSSFNNIARDRRFVVTGYANSPGEVKNDRKLVTEASELGRHLVESLK